MLKNLEGKTLKVMWTVTEGTNDLYSIYFDGQLYISHLSFDEFYPIYKGLHR